VPILNALPAAEGRGPDQVLILPTSPDVGSTEAEARRLAREVNDLTDTEVGRKRLAGRFGGRDFTDLPSTSRCSRGTFSRPPRPRRRAVGPR
jgi:hypothetical protein